MVDLPVSFHLDPTQMFPRLMSFIDARGFGRRP